MKKRFVAFMLWLALVPGVVFADVASIAIGAGLLMAAAAIGIALTAAGSPALGAAIGLHVGAAGLLYLMPGYNDTPENAAANNVAQAPANAPKVDLKPVSDADLSGGPLPAGMSIQKAADSSKPLWWKGVVMIGGVPYLPEGDNASANMGGWSWSRVLSVCFGSSSTTDCHMKGVGTNPQYSVSIPDEHSPLPNLDPNFLHVMDGSHYFQVVRGATHVELTRVYVDGPYVLANCPGKTVFDAVNGACRVEQVDDPALPDAIVEFESRKIIPNPAKSGAGSVKQTPEVTMAIDPEGTARFYDRSGDETEPTVQIIPADDGSRIVSRQRYIPVTSPSGVPDVAIAVEVTPFDKDGKKAGPSVPAISKSLNSDETITDDWAFSTGSGQSVSAEFDNNPYPPGSGLTSGAELAAPSSGSGTGGCTGDCSTESTQLANKGLLQSIKDFFTGTATAPGDPEARTAEEIKNAGLSGSGSFSGLLGWSLPAHASQCPTSSFSWENRTFTIDAHCQLVDEHFGVFRVIMTAVFSISALFIVLKA